LIKDHYICNKLYNRKGLSSPSKVNRKTPNPETPRNLPPTYLDGLWMTFSTCKRQRKFFGGLGGALLQEVGVRNSLCGIVDFFT